VIQRREFAILSTGSLRTRSGFADPSTHFPVRPVRAGTRDHLCIVQQRHGRAERIGDLVSLGPRPVT
jgi:hypothetical protein